MARYRANRPVLVDGLVLMPGVEFEAHESHVSERVASGAVTPLDAPKTKTKAKAKTKTKAKTKAK